MRRYWLAFVVSVLIVSLTTLSYFLDSNLLLTTAIVGLGSCAGPVYALIDKHRPQGEGFSAHYRGGGAPECGGLLPVAVALRRGVDPPRYIKVMIGRSIALWIGGVATVNTVALACWSGRSVTLWLTLLQVVLYGTMAVLSRYPEWHNYPIKVTDANRASLYRASGLLMARLAMLASLLQLVACVQMSGLLEGVWAVLALCLILALLLGAVVLLALHHRAMHSLEKA